MQVMIALDQAYQDQVNKFVAHYNNKYPDNEITAETAVRWFFLDGLEAAMEKLSEVV